MAREIERRYLVNKRLWKQALCQVHDIEKLTQGYLCKKPTVRIRLSSNNFAWLTVKGEPTEFTRDEFEYDISTTDAEQMLSMCDKLLEKTRHWIQTPDTRLWSVDEFAGLNKGLLLAEVELCDAEQDVLSPPWVLKEVTYDERYTNTYIIDHKVPKR